MQTLSEFLSQWQPAISQQAESVSDNIEEGRDMSRFLLLERQFASSVDEVVRDYSKSGSFALHSLPSFEVGYLAHIRLLEGYQFAKFLAQLPFARTETDASEWIEFFAIDSWHHFLVYKWRHDFSRIYPPKT